MISSESSSLRLGIDDGDEGAAVSLFGTIVIECERDLVLVVEFL